MRRLAALAVASSFVITLPARAQDYPGAPAPGTVPVHVRNEEPMIRHRLTTREGMTIASCTGDCTMYVYPGQYTFESSETEELRAGKKKLNIGGPTTVDVSPGSKSSRTTGLIVGSLGSAAFIVGLVGVYVVALADVICDVGTTTNCTRPSYTPWVLMLVGGAAAATTGWVMFGTAGTKVRAETYAAAPRVSFGAVPLPGGGGVAAFGFAF